jgi:hypothetical protein
MNSFRTVPLKEFRRGLNKAFSNLCGNLVNADENSGRYYRLLELKNRVQNLYPLGYGPDCGEVHLSREDCVALWGPDSEGVLQCVTIP